MKNNNYSKPDHKVSNLFFDAIRRVGAFFNALPLTISDRERQQMTTARYAQSGKWLRNLFGWNSSENSNYLKSAKHWPGLQPVTKGEMLPLHHFELIWFGEEGSTTGALVSTTLDLNLIRKWIQILNETKERDRILTCWKARYPVLYARAVSVVRYHRDNRESVYEAMEAKEDKSTLVAIGNAQIGDILSIDYDLGADGTGLLALILAAYGACPLRWLHGSYSALNTNGKFTIHAPGEDEIHAVGLSLLASQMDPGINWNKQTHDSSLCQLFIPNGLQQILGRPAIPINRTSGADFWRLIGELCPVVGDPVWAMGKSRERGSTFGFLTPNCPSSLMFSLFQSGASPIIRHIIGIKGRDASISNASALLKLAEGCRLAAQAAGHGDASDLPTEFFEGITRLLTLHDDSETPGLINRPQFGIKNLHSNDLGELKAIGVMKDPSQPARCVRSILGTLEAGRMPNSDAREDFRKYFLGKSTPVTRRSIQIHKHFIFRTVTALIRWGAMQPTLESKAEGCDPMTRDAQLIYLQRKAHRSAKQQATQLAQSTGENFLRIVRGTVFFADTEKPWLEKLHNKVKYSGKLIAVLFDFILLAVKRRFGALVLEERSTLLTAVACDLTLVTDVQPIFRTPADDLVSLPKWILQPGDESADSVCVSLAPLLKQVRSHEQLRKQVETINDICKCLEPDSDVDGCLTALQSSCRVNWENDADILRKIAPSSIVHALRPQIELTHKNRIDWWLLKLGLPAGMGQLSKRKPLENLMALNPDAVILDLLNVAAIRVKNRPERGEPSVCISRSYVDAFYAKVVEAPKYQGRNGGEEEEEQEDEKYDIEAFKQAPRIKAPTIIDQDALVRLLKSLTAEKIDELLNPADDNMEGCAMELQDLLGKHLRASGRKDFKSLIMQAMNDESEIKIHSVEKMLNQFVPQWQSNPNKGREPFM